MTTCITCHGEDGRGGTQGGAPLTRRLAIGDIVSTVTNGRNAMPAYGSVMSQADMQDLAHFCCRICSTSERPTRAQSLAASVSARRDRM